MLPAGSRGVGAVEFLLGAIPEWAALALGLLTQLGDLWFLLSLLGVAYWRAPDRRREVAALAGATLAGIGLYRGLKHLLALPRPGGSLGDPGSLPMLLQPLYGATATATGYGFPSGHATAATVVYGGLAGVLVAGSRRRRRAVAAGAVGLVSFTRVALGVHYLVDVVAGVALGAAVLFAWRSLDATVPPDHRPTAGFGLAVPPCGLYYLASGGEPWSALALGVAVGAVAGFGLGGTGGRSRSPADHP